MQIIFPMKLQDTFYIAQLIFRSIGLDLDYMWSSATKNELL